MAKLAILNHFDVKMANNQNDQFGHFGNRSPCGDRFLNPKMAILAIFWAASKMTILVIFGLKIDRRKAIDAAKWPLGHFA